MKKLAFLSVLGCFAFAPSMAQSQTHCDANERVVFSCSMGKKTASVCASTTFGPSEGYLQYRFGAPGNIEMTYPSGKQHPQDQFRAFYGTPVMDDGSRAMFVSLEFGVNDYSYELSTFAKQDTSETSLTVTRAGKTLATLKCRPQSIINADLSYRDVLTGFGID